MAALNENHLYLALQKRDDGRTRYYRSFIEPLAYDMQFFLENIKKLFPHYPDHGINHSVKILDYLSGIINQQMLDKLSSLDILVLIFSALFHDSAMALINANEIEKDSIREAHHLQAETVIDRYFDENLNSLNEKDRIKRAVTFVCKAHGLPLDELLSDKQFHTIDKVDTMPIHYGILAFLLRIGDLMDLEADRVNNFRMSMFYSHLAPDSQAHNRRHQCVDVYNYNPDAIKVTVHAENVAQYKIWDNWLTWLKDDLEKFNALYSKEGFILPNLTREIKTSAGADFVVQDLRFEIDERGSLWDIISQSIYTNELDFVRELLQNAIDASLKVEYQDTNKVLAHKSPRSWRGTTNSVIVSYSEKDSTLCVVDQGIGMDDKDLKDYLFKVSSTGKVARNTRDFDFPGIAQYGIGFVSCLFNAKAINLYTSRNGQSLYKVSLENGKNYALVETQNNHAGYIGTSVVLKLRHQFKFTRVLNYIYETFVYPSVDIQVINSDSLYTLLISKDNIVARLSSWEEPYEYIKYIKRKQNEFAIVLHDLKEKERQLNSIIVQHSLLFQYYKENYLKIYNVKNYQDYNRRVQAFLAKCGDDLKQSFEPTTLTEELICQQSEEQVAIRIRKAYENNELQLHNALAFLRGRIDEHSLPIYPVESKDVSDQNDWKYLVARFDSDLDLKEITKTKDAIPLKYGTGLVLIRNKEADYDIGLEYITINGFLFSEGKVCKRIVKLTHSRDAYHRVGQDRGFMIGIDNFRDDIRQDIDNYFYEHVFRYDDDYEREDASLDFENGSDYVIDPSYDEIAIVDNMIKKNLERDFYEPCSSYYTEDLYEEHTIKDPHADLLEAAKELQTIIGSDKNAFFQDGIAIPSHLNSLFPLGLFRIVCNCTADARMKLNVSRHSTSEIPSDVEQWIKNVGGIIQEKTLIHTIEALAELKLDVSLANELWSNNEWKSVFESQAFFSLISIIRKMNTLA